MRVLCCRPFHASYSPLPSPPAPSPEAKNPPLATLTRPDPIYQQLPRHQARMPAFCSTALVPLLPSSTAHVLRPEALSLLRQEAVGARKLSMSRGAGCRRMASPRTRDWQPCIEYRLRTRLTTPPEATGPIFACADSGIGEVVRPQES